MRRVRTDAADGRARGALCPGGGCGARRRLPALPGARDRGRAGSRRARRRRRRSRTVAAAVASATSSSSSASPAPPTKTRWRGKSRSCASSPTARSRSSRPQTSSTAAPTGEPSAASRRASVIRREHRPALGHLRRDGGHRRLGSLLVPVPRQPGLRVSRCDSSGEATSSASSRRASRTGTRTSRTRVVSSPRSPGSSSSRERPEGQVERLVRSVCETTSSATVFPGLSSETALMRSSESASGGLDRHDHVAGDDSRFRSRPIRRHVLDETPAPFVSPIWTPR